MPPALAIAVCVGGWSRARFDTAAAAATCDVVLIDVFSSSSSLAIPPAALMASTCSEQLQRLAIAHAAVLHVLALESIRSNSSTAPEPTKAASASKLARDKLAIMEAMCSLASVLPCLSRRTKGAVTFVLISSGACSSESPSSALAAAATAPMEPTLSTCTSGPIAPPFTMMAE